VRRIALLLFVPFVMAGEKPPSVLDVEIQQLRNARGLIQACLTRHKSHFPDCRHDPAALKRTVAAGTRHLRFENLEPGSYAVTLFHDENANARLDTLLGVPREGFGFSRNPVVRFAAPRFDNVRIELAPGFTRAPVRMQYIL
jgi:uncharacterized protein (DUF2141 family)